MKLACAADEELCPLESNAAKGLAADDYLICGGSMINLVMISEGDDADLQDWLLDSSQCLLEDLMETFF